MRQPLFSTLKRIQSSYHSSVGRHTATTWSQYNLVRVDWRDGRVTEHLERLDFVNGQPQWSGCSYGVEDTVRILNEFGVRL